MSKTALATLCGLVGYGIFGFSFLFSGIAMELTTPFVLLSCRFLTAFLAMNLMMAFGKVRMNLRGKPVKMLLLLGLVQPIIYFICENYGISMTSTAFSGVMLGLVPIAGLVLSRMFLKERCTALQVICAVGSVAGVALTATGGSGTFSPLGTLLLLGAAISAALFNVISRGISQSFTPFERTYVMFGLGSVVFTLIALIENGRNLTDLWMPLTSPVFWGAVLYLSVISSICAFLLINYALNHISSARISVFSNFTTVISVLAGIFIMRESFEPLQLLGIAVIVLSIFGVTVRKHSEE